MADLKEGASLSADMAFEVMAGENPSGVAKPIQTDADGKILVTATITGGATEVTLADIEGDVDTLVADVALIKAAVDGVEAFLSTIEGETAGILLSAEVAEDWDEAGRAMVNPIVGQAGVSAGAGAVAANTIRTTSASDDPAVTLLGTIDTDTGAVVTSITAIETDIAALETIATSIETAAESLDDKTLDPAGADRFLSIDVDESAESVAISDSRITFIHAFNNHTTDVAFLKIYDNNDGTSDHTDTPVAVFPLGPKGGFTSANGLAAIFSTGIDVRATTGVAHADTGAPAANQVIVNIEKINL